MQQASSDDDGQGWLPLDADIEPLTAADADAMTDEPTAAPPPSATTKAADDTSMTSDLHRSENAVNGVMNQLGSANAHAASSPLPPPAASPSPPPPPSSSPLPPFSTSPLPPLLRQKTEFIQRLSLAPTDRLPCTAVLQRIDVLHKRSMEGAGSAAVSASSHSSSSAFSAAQQQSVRASQPRAPRLADGAMSEGEGEGEESDSQRSDVYEDAAEWQQQQMEAAAAAAVEDDSSERLHDDDDGVLVSSPAAQLRDCIFALNEGESKLAVAYGRHLFLHSLQARTASLSQLAADDEAAAYYRYCDDCGEVSMEQRVQGPHSALSDASDAQQAEDDDTARLEFRLQRDASSITAVCWYRSEHRDWLMVGYGSGMLRCYHSSGRLVFAHAFHTAGIRQLRTFLAHNSSLSNMSDSLMHSTAEQQQDSAAEQQQQQQHDMTAASSALSPSFPFAASSSFSPSSGTPPGHRLELLLVYADALCVVDGKSIRLFLRVDLDARSQLLSRSRRDQLSLSLQSLQQMKDGVWRHSKWRLQGQETVEDAVSCGRLDPSGIEELFAPPASRLASSSSPCFLVAGSEPMLAFYSPAAAPFSLAAAVSVAGQLGTMVASAVTSRVFGFAKSWWSRDSNRQAAQQPVSASSSSSPYTAAPIVSRAKKPRLLSLTPLSMPLVDLPLSRCLRDEPRSLASIRLDPLCGHYAVCTDSLGRVLLLETEHCLVVRLWKGYREAKTAWIVHSNSDSGESSSSGSQQPQPDIRFSVSSAPSSPSPLPPLSLFLLLYAPRRGLLELWACPHGKRIGAMQVGYGCALLQFELPGNAAAASQALSSAWDGEQQRAAATAAAARLYPAVDVLDPAGQLRRVVVIAQQSRSVHSAAAQQSSSHQ